MKKIIFTAALALSLTLASCDDFLDINNDPDSPSSNLVDDGMLMPAVEMNIAASYGDFLRITGGYFAQHYAQITGASNYLPYSKFEMLSNQSDNTYTYLCQRTLANLQTILEKSEASEEWGTYLAATVLRAFTYEVLVDCYGETPYTEALNPDNIAPKYDDGKTVYESIIAELDNALSKATEQSPVCTSFLFPSRSAGEWRKFANALKLKLLMRMAGVEDSNIDIREAVAALIAEDNFPDSDIAFSGCWSNATGQRNPFFANEFSTTGATKNIIANQAIIGTMIEKDANGAVVYTDPRLKAFFQPNEDGEYAGGLSGTNFSGTQNLGKKHKNQPVVSYDMPICLLSVAEVEFFLAEYCARYDAGDAAAHYAAAIEASFASAGVDGADEYLARYPYNAAEWKKTLGIAKWVALAGVNNFEAWCELRRLRFPAFGSSKGSDFYTEGDEKSFDVSKYEWGTLYTPLMVSGPVGDNHVLERFPYAEISVSHNENAPKFTNNDYIKPVFWAEGK